MTELDINYTDYITYKLLSSKKCYERDIEIEDLDITTYKKVVDVESKIIELESKLYDLLHKQRRLDSKLEHYIRRNMQYTNEFLEADSDFAVTSKKLDRKFIEYAGLEEELRSVVSNFKQLNDEETIEYLFGA